MTYSEFKENYLEAQTRGTHWDEYEAMCAVETEEGVRYIKIANMEKTTEYIFRYEIDAETGNVDIHCIDDEVELEQALEIIGECQHE